MISRPYQAILVTQEGARLRITLNRPERRNAIGPQMSSELLYALADAEQEPSVQVVILTGAGKAFCAGGDFAQMTQSNETEPLLPARGDYADLLLAMLHSTRPIIARVNGLALGGGLGLVAASTFALAADSAELGTPEVQVGLFPMMISAVLERLVPRRALLQMMLLGERFPAPRAVELGLLNRAVPAEQLDLEVDKLASALSEKSPSTLALGLRAFADQSDMPLAQALPLLRERLSACLLTEDAQEGLLAFLQKRPPVWRGR